MVDILIGTRSHGSIGIKLMVCPKSHMPAWWHCGKLQVAKYINILDQPMEELVKWCYKNYIHLKNSMWNKSKFKSSWSQTVSKTHKILVLA